MNDLPPLNDVKPKQINLNGVLAAIEAAKPGDLIDIYPKVVRGPDLKEISRVLDGCEIVVRLTLSRAEPGELLGHEQLLSRIVAIQKILQN